MQIKKARITINSNFLMNNTSTDIYLYKYSFLLSFVMFLNENDHFFYSINEIQF